MKKIVAFLCTLLCILGLAACGESEADLAKKAEVERVNQGKIEEIQNALFYDAVYLLDVSAGNDENYYWLSSYGNEEIEALFPYDNVYVYEVDGHGFKTALESFRLAKDTVGDLDDIGEVKAEIATGEDWYDLNGRKINKPQNGINIIRYSDGSSRKVLLR